MLKDRWMIYEHLKKTKGHLDVRLIQGVSQIEVIEGINEYLIWLRYND